MVGISSRGERRRYHDLHGHDGLVALAYVVPEPALDRLVLIDADSQSARADAIRAVDVVLFVSPVAFVHMPQSTTGAEWWRLRSRCPTSVLSVPSS